MEYNINNTMKTIYHIKASLMAIAAMAACTEMEIRDESQDATNNGLLQELCITGKDFQLDGETRSSVTIGESGASFAWDDDDVIGIFPDKGDQVSFAMDEGAGTQTATFSGGGWALKSSAKYAAYYPHVYENRDPTAIPVSYVGQTQNGNGNTDHIGAYDFMAAGVSTPENGAVAFDMQHLGALVQLTITVPEPSTLSKISLYCASEFTETGTIDLTEKSPSIAVRTQSSTLEIALNNVSTSEANENITVYFMTAPVDLTGTEITVIVHCFDETILKGKITGKNLQAGKAYRHFADKLSGETDEPEESIPNNQIWYTATAKVDPYCWEHNFGANIESNIWNPVTGKGVITFDGEVTKVGEWAFYECSAITSMIIPNSVITIEELAFSYCTGLEKITMGNNLTTIGASAFDACSVLQSIKIPEGVTTIGPRAFYGCSSLVSITIPDSVTTIGELAFHRCFALTEFRGKFASEDNRCLVIDGVLNTYAAGCIDTSYTIPDEVKTIGYNSFYCCHNLTKIIILKGVTTIGPRAFYNCSSLVSVTIPDSVTSIGNDSFSHCRRLIDITVPDSITKIGDNAFNECNSLTSIVIPEGVSSIGAGVFYACSNLTNVAIPSSVISIGSESFCECKSLASLTIPANVTSIGVSAFARCTNLERVYCESITPPIIFENTFSNSSRNIEIHVPPGSLNNYKAADYWKDLNLVEEGNSIQAVDLGLSVKWANCNIGANNPHEYGDYFAWGEIYTKDSFSEANYAYYNSTATSSSGKWNFIGRNICGTDYDAAKHILGDGWAMPTYLQMQELIDKCTWTWTTCNDVAGFEIKSNINNNTIFLPAAGFSGNSSSVGYASWCWTGVMYENGTYYGWGYHLNATTNGIQIEGRMRSYGMPIRPVYNE